VYISAARAAVCGPQLKFRKIFQIHLTYGNLF
jgi:hypothetical protein